MKAKDMLTFFYIYLEEKNYNISQYEDREQNGSNSDNLLSSFSINDKCVIFNSIDSKIIIGNKNFPINLNQKGNIFSEYDRILKDYKYKLSDKVRVM